MKLTKFPVTSPSSAEYRVDVLPWHTSREEAWRVHIFVKERWFRWRRVASGTYLRDPQTAVEAATRAVIEHDDRQRKLDGYARQFREWDGVIRREEAN